jgi:hypothetical protein
MKKYILLLFAALTIMGTSCKDYLEVSSPSVFSSETVYSSPLYALYAVNGIYSVLDQSGAYGQRIPIHFGLPSDIEYCTNGSFWENGARGVGNYYLYRNNDQIKTGWEALYKLIERANLVIAGIEGSPSYTGGDADSKRKMEIYLGEALTLRALAYFQVVRNWGDVPFNTIPTQSDLSNVYLSATDRDTIMDALLVDLDKAAELLPWIGSESYITPERVTKGFAHGLAARIALARGGYSIRNKAGYPTERSTNYLDYYKIAAKHCAAVINSNKHDLNSSFKKIWTDVCQWKYDVSTYESMFEIGMGQSYSGEMGYTIGVRFNNNKIYGYGNNTNGYTTCPYYYYSFEDGDTRRDLTIAPYQFHADGYEEFRTGTNILAYGFQKWDQRYMTADWIAKNLVATGKVANGINVIEMRYSDVLLMYAEAVNEISGPDGTYEGCSMTAIDALKKVRLRAFAGNEAKVNTYLTGVRSDFFNAIVNERAWEFGGEAVRKYDLIRWNLIETKLQEFRNAMEAWFAGSPAKVFNKPAVSVPDTIWYKISSVDKQTLMRDSINFYYSRTESPDYLTAAGYKSAKWFHGLTVSTSTGDQTTRVTVLNNVDYIGSGVFQVRNGVCENRHLFPIPQSVVDASNGKLNFSYGYDLNIPFNTSPKY